MNSIRFLFGFNGTPMLYSEIVLLGGLFVRLIEMSTTVKRLWGGSPRTTLGRLWRRYLGLLCEKLQRSYKGTQAFSLPLVVFSLAFLISMQAILDFFGSDTCGVSGTRVLCVVSLLVLMYT